MELRRHLTYANVVSTLCLFILLGGSAVAVSTGAIDSREIKNSTIRSKDVRNNSLTGADVRNRSLLARDFKSGQLPAGAAGPAGPAGAPGAARAYARVLPNGTLDAARSKGVVAVSRECSSSPGCVPAQASDEEQCFKLGFTPSNAVATATPPTGPPGNTIVSVEIPASPYVEGVGGCPPGYTHAQTLTLGTDNTARPHGFFIVFN